MVKTEKTNGLIGNGSISRSLLFDVWGFSKRECETGNLKRQKPRFFEGSKLVSKYDRFEKQIRSCNLLKFPVDDCNRNTHLRRNLSKGLLRRS